MLDGRNKQKIAELIKNLKRITIEVKGRSMFPLISDGDKVEIEKTRIFPGDIILYQKNGDLILHRYYFRIKDYAICCGDNSCRIEKIKFKDILGKVTKVNGKVLQERFIVKVLLYIKVLLKVWIKF